MINQFVHRINCHACNMFTHLKLIKTKRLVEMTIPFFIWSMTSEPALCCSLVCHLLTSSVDYSALSYQLYGVIFFKFNRYLLGIVFLRMYEGQNKLQICEGEKGSVQL